MTGKKIYYITKIVSTMNDLFCNIMILIISVLYYCYRQFFHSIGQSFYLVKTRIKQICLFFELESLEILNSS